MWFGSFQGKETFRNIGCNVCRVDGETDSCLVPLECVLLSPFFQGPFLLLSAVIYWLRLILIIVNGLLWLAMKVLYLKWHTHVLYAHVRHISIDVYRNMHLCLPAHLCTSLKSHSSFFIFHSSFLWFLPLFLSLQKVTLRQLSFRWELDESKLWKTSRPIAFWVITQPVTITTVFQMATQWISLRWDQLDNGCR